MATMNRDKLISIVCWCQPSLTANVIRIYTVKSATLYLRDITINSAVRVGNYLDQKETRLCSNNYTLNQTDTLCPF